MPAVELDLAEMGFAFFGMVGDGVDGCVRGDGVQDEGGDLAGAQQYIRNIKIARPAL